MGKAFWTHAQGQAGVYATASRLSLLGHTPYFPSVDYGVDLMLENGIRLQVKSAKLRNHPGYQYGAYSFDIRKSYLVLNPGKIYRETRSRTYKGIVDFMVFWCIDENRFFVVPAAEVTKTVWVSARGNYLCRRKKQNHATNIASYEEAWHLLDVDSTLSEIESQQEIVEAGREI